MAEFNFSGGLDPKRLAEVANANASLPGQARADQESAQRVNQAALLPDLARGEVEARALELLRVMSAWPSGVLNQAFWLMGARGHLLPKWQADEASRHLWSPEQVAQRAAELARGIASEAAIEAAAQEEARAQAAAQELRWRAVSVDLGLDPGDAKARYQTPERALWVRDQAVAQRQESAASTLMAVVAFGGTCYQGHEKDWGLLPTLLAAAAAGYTAKAFGPLLIRQATAVQQGLRVSSAFGKISL